MALTYSRKAILGSLPPSFKLRGVDHQIYQLTDFEASRLLVVAFICNHCPYVIATQTRINLLAEKVITQGGAFIAINSNDASQYPQDSFEAMIGRARGENFIFPYLHDETQEVAKAYGAMCTPEFFLYQKIKGVFRLVYQGRLDDSWKDSQWVKVKDLENAIDAVLEGKAPSLFQPPALGCSIKWKLESSV